MKGSYPSFLVFVSIVAVVGVIAMFIFNGAKELAMTSAVLGGLIGLSPLLGLGNGKVSVTITIESEQNGS
jgi:uncharacterized protein (DUF58 family)